MFDHVHVDYPLPDGVELQGFQTKDLECVLDDYRITVDGHLEVMETRYEDVPRSEWGPEPPDKDKLDHFIWKMRQTRLVPVGWRRVMHHGYVNFYTSAGDRQAGTFVWYEYRAKFTDGLLVELVRVVDERP